MSSSDKSLNKSEKLFEDVENACQVEELEDRDDSCDNSEDNKELFEFDGSYLKDLNLIRKKLNLVEIVDENTEPSEQSVKDCDISELSYAPPKKKVRVDSSYISLKSKGSVRQEQNVKSEAIFFEKVQHEPIFKYRIKFTKDEAEDVEASEESTWTTDYTSSSTSIETYRERGKSTPELIFENTKFAESDASTSGQTSLILKNLDNYRTNKEISTSASSQLSNLNIPDDNSNNQKIHIIPRVTIIENNNEDIDSEDSDDLSLWRYNDSNRKLTTSLDVPKAIDQKLAFPAIANVAEFVRNLANEVDFQKVCESSVVNKDLEPESQRIYSLKQTQHSNDYFNVLKSLEAKSEDDDNNDELVSKLCPNYSKMQVYRRKQAVSMDFYDLGSSSRSEIGDSNADLSSDSDGVRTCCCLWMCFARTRRKDEQS